MNIPLSLRTGLMAAVMALMPLCAFAQDDEPVPPPPGNYQMAPAAVTDLQVRMNALETQLRNVTGQLERAQFQNTQLQQTLQRMSSDSEARFQMLEKRTGTLEAHPPAAASAPPPPAMAPIAAPSPVAPPPASPAAPSAPAATQGEIDTPPPGDHVLGTLSSDGTKKDAPQAMYDKAFQALREAKYDDAEARFRGFLKTYPKDRLAENARYWLGETYYVRGKYQDAAVTFAEGFQQFPAGSKAPDNLLKLSMSLGSMNKKQDACTTLGELKKRFPNASAVIRNRAEQEKKSLSCT